ncbi:hypothetical protein CEXT_558201 [Caerostris extrusa]|uniref:Uncharacterized protein n=1 Tax=Caerostris extrusa TaxID=172846 RepID=A0AAV4WC00_CAEEX|nr:hypothetical protein CEXT_558201 [Caerostris extrusa]
MSLPTPICRRGEPPHQICARAPGREGVARTPSRRKWSGPSIISARLLFPAEREVARRHALEIPCTIVTTQTYSSANVYAISANAFFCTRHSVLSDVFKWTKYVKHSKPNDETGNEKYRKIDRFLSEKFPSFDLVKRAILPWPTPLHLRMPLSHSPPPEREGSEKRVQTGIKWSAGAVIVSLNNAL